MMIDVYCVLLFRDTGMKLSHDQTGNDVGVRDSNRSGLSNWW
jgi:hypothetical protein